MPGRFLGKTEISFIPNPYKTWSFWITEEEALKECWLSRLSASNPVSLLCSVTLGLKSAKHISSMTAGSLLGSANRQMLKGDWKAGRGTHMLLSFLFLIWSPSPQQHFILQKSFVPVTAIYISLQFFQNSQNQLQPWPDSPLEFPLQKAEAQLHSVPSETPVPATEYPLLRSQSQLHSPSSELQWQSNKAEPSCYTSRSQLKGAPHQVLKVGFNLVHWFP